jgi:hypothetical protein
VQPTSAVWCFCPRRGRSLACKGSKRQPAVVGSSFSNEATGHAAEPDQQPASNKRKVPLLKRIWNRIASKLKHEISGGEQASGQVF